MLHPLSSVTAQEISKASELVKKYNEEKNPGKKLKFKVLALKEPPKALVVPYLENPTQVSPPNRVIFARFYFANSPEFYETLVDVTESKVLNQIVLPKEFHGQGEADGIIEFEKIACSDPLVLKELERLNLPEGAKICCDPWPYGSDGDQDEQRMWQCYFYISSLSGTQHPEFNHYSLPLDFSCVIDDVTQKVIRIERLPTHFDGTKPGDGDTWIEAKPAQYAADLRSEEVKDFLRKDLKPLLIKQPEGVSFQVDGEKVDWQKWSFRISFNYREGMVLNDVRYDGRKVFYRLSLSEMNVPYGDPRRPYTRKSAFDLGDLGAGVCANDLQLGCDCLGTIHYFNGWISDQEGRPVERPNAICMHEVDGGIGWKHTNFRSNIGSVVRKRELVLQMILTVANYEYGIYWTFDTNGDITFSVAATGIMSTVPVSQNDPEQFKSSYGIVVGPGVFAPIHQHIFCVRIDPAIDGYSGSKVVLEENVPMEMSEENKWGVGFNVVQSEVTKSGWTDSNPSANRVVKIINPSILNPICKKPVGYKFVPLTTQTLLAHPDSMHYKRAEFAKHHLYWTKFAEDELYAGSDHTNQSRGGWGIEGWCNRNEDLGDQPVIWHSFGLTHNPRVEDWPVMPVETIKFMLRPCNFHVENPGIDMPPSIQAVNQSVLHVSNGEEQCCK